MWKEAGIAWFEAISKNLIGVTEETHENLATIASLWAET